MADYVAFGGKVAGDTAYAQGFNGLDVRDDGRRPFSSVAIEECLGNGRGIHQRVVEDGVVRMLVNALDMLRCGKTQTFIGLFREGICSVAEGCFLAY